jgi:hypothetical protein
MMLRWRSVEPTTPTTPTTTDEEPPAYVYAATDIRPRQAREIELCEKASHFDWQYTGAFFLGFLGSVYLNIDILKHSGYEGLRMLGPGMVGFTWGGFLSGGYLSLPKCDPLWAQGPPPEGDVRSSWPTATAIAMIAAVTGPAMDYAFLGPVKVGWSVEERSARIFLGGGMAVLGALFPYVLPPKTWSAKKEIERIRVQGLPGGASFTYTVAF